MSKLESSGSQNAVVLPEERFHQEGFDLLEVIVFFWKSRWHLALGALCGALCSIGLWAYKKKGEGSSDHPRQQINLQLVLPEGSSTAIASSLRQWNGFLNTAAGAKAFYEQLANSAGIANLPVPTWIDRQINGQGILGPLTNAGSVVSIPLRNEFRWKDDEVVRIVSPALDALTAGLEQSTINTRLQMAEEKIQLKIKMSELRLKALQFFEKNSKLSPVVQKNLLNAITRQLVDTTSGDPMIVLLSTGQEARAALLSEYNRYQASLDDFLDREKALSQENLIPKQSGSQITIEPASPSEGPLLLRLQKSLTVLAIVGMIVGSMLGGFTAALHFFWKINSKRLHQLLREL